MLVRRVRCKGRRRASWRAAVHAARGAPLTGRPCLQPRAGSLLPSLTLHPPWLAQPCVLQGGRAGIGKGAAVLTEVETFDPATDSWRRAAPMCTPRTSLAAAALGGRLYAVGGQDGRSTHDSCEW